MRDNTRPSKTQRTNRTGNECNPLFVRHFLVCLGSMTMKSKANIRTFSIIDRINYVISTHFES